MRSRTSDPIDTGSDAERGADQYASFAGEDAQDRAMRLYALVAAMLLHATLLAVRFPALEAQTQGAPEKPVHRLEPIRFRPPPPERQDQLPRPAARRVPIPDPTPDDPEPIRLASELEEQLPLPSADLVVGIPAAPPPTEPAAPIHAGWASPPVKTYAPPPQYTEPARRARIQGVVIVQAIIDEQGNVSHVKLLEGLPLGLDQAALDAIRQWRFEPARMTDGRPVAVYYTLTVNFELR